ncbi:hypothetical protein SEA_LUMOS_104 [Mycobacterium phage Lumos]|uniref:Uncharacterized protein n=1 Tax=Mycobacterium phage Lumos TaxID=1701852 RepID=A0A0K2CMM0_9CAUD|nr:hypothetical protein AVU96_gp078 [Mycobacterium phage Snenia]YP_010012560.1 hypothetical protein J4T93_gp076 [Mycobacterium phage Lumos]ASM62839.1 hypothetical protein SEA_CLAUTASTROPHE_103 [Mycobacterium phage Clautastrophe]QDF16686.1 hypothetical protein PBI_MSGREEN_105 [Mycobacterium phage MsGreen]QPL14986.1 hypothetical protein SEA_JUBIE_104 [Mycobacterium phage Jubie]ALA06618.1 hypothetical protein SEA_LUMOS_104 [Mycobacterium phage Lumos]ALF01557.1 hypothetical protein SNENIA_103 [My
MDPVLIEKQRRGAVQELRDRKAWPTATEPVDPKTEFEPEAEKPKRGRPAKQDAPKPEAEDIEVAVSE